jgi:dihydroflavonol-4-reductase
MGKILVTGATGLLGAHLTCTLLSRGVSVKALKRERSSFFLFERVAALYGITSEHPDLNWVSGSLEDVFSLEEALRDVETVFHCAAFVSFFKKDADQMFRTNIRGTGNLVNACLRAGNPYLLHVSSIAALGRSTAGEHINEQSAWMDSGQNTRYAVSKHLSELEVWRGFEEGLPGCIINPGIIIGAGDGTSGSNMFFKRVNKGLRFFPTGVNGFVSVEDTVSLMLLLWDKKVMHERFIAVSENVSYKYLLEEIATACGAGKPKVSISGTLYLLLKILTALLEPLIGKRLPVSYENIRLSNHVAYYSNEKARAAGMHFEPLSLSILRTAQQLNPNA